MDGQNAVILFFSVFYAIALSSISKCRVFDTGAWCRDRGMRWRVFFRLLVGFFIVNLLPLYSLYLLLTTDSIVPRMVTNPKVIIAAAVTCLSVFAIPRVLHGVFAIRPMSFYQKHIWEKVARDAKAEPDDCFLWHLIPGLLYTAIWPALAVLLLHWQHFPPAASVVAAPAGPCTVAGSTIIGKLS